MGLLSTLCITLYRFIILFPPIAFFNIELLIVLNLWIYAVLAVGFSSNMQAIQ